MGFGSFFKGIVSNPVRALTAVSTFGSSEIARAVIPKKILAPLITGVGAAASLITANPAPLLAAQAYLKADRTFTARPQGVQPMGLNIGGILGQVGTIFGGAQNPYFQGISNVAGLASQFFPQPTANLPAVRQPLVATPTMAAAGPVMRAGAMVARGFFNRFPNLAVAIQQLRARGMNVKRAQLYSMLKRFGPEVLITGGILTAAAVSELMVAGPGHRRMNPGNVKALRRSLRRLESFHHLCQRADKLRRPRSRKGSKSTSSGTFVRQG